MRVVLSGGGTGGHIYPALALAEAIKAQDPQTEFLYVGSKRGVESTIVPKTGMPFEQLTVQGFKRSLSLDNVQTVRLFFKAVKEAKQILREFKPDVVVGTGGYVSGAVVYAAQRLGIATVIHEQNSVAGITNKFLSRGATRIGVAFDVALDEFPRAKTRLVGNPRAQQVASQTTQPFSWDSLDLSNDVPTLLIFGGSQGAPAINLAVLDAVEHFNDADYQVVAVTGPKRYDNFMRLLDERHLHLNNNVKILPYIDNMPAVLRQTTAIVSRAGATSIAEITALGLPSILVPSPFVTGNHQVKNAQSLVDAGAALMISDPDLTGAALIEAADKLLNDATYNDKMASRADKLGMRDAADQLYALMKEAIAINKK